MKFLEFFQLTDKYGNLSISNAAVYASIISYAVFPSWGSVAFFTLSILNYCHKRAEDSKYERMKFESDKSCEIYKRIQALEQNISELYGVNAKVMKQAEETQNLISKTNLALLFNPATKRKEESI